MSVAALVALFHDIVLTIGVYALSGFPVTPAAVTGLLAILGFSMYDTVVVFDKVRENTHELRRSRRRPTPRPPNLAVNQTLVRSINTSIVALIPIGAILYVSAVQLGASSLKDLALAQFVGMAAGVYSSIFIAPRILVQMKSARGRGQARRQAREGAGPRTTPTATPPCRRSPRTCRSRTSRAGRRGRGRPRGRRPVSRRRRRRRRTALRRRAGRGRIAPQPRGPVRAERVLRAASSRPGSRSPSGARSDPPARD